MIKRSISRALGMALSLITITACTLNVDNGSNTNSGGVSPIASNTPFGSTGGGSAALTAVPNIPAGETGRVTYVIDGDTIDVDINGTIQRVRYVGVNTPESDEPCYSDARNANSALVMGKIVTLVRDRSNTDRYDRLLRYVYADGIFVNAALVTQGYAEGVEYSPDTGQTAYFRTLEIAAAAANRGCHPTGIFNDGSTTR